MKLLHSGEGLVNNILAFRGEEVVPNDRTDGLQSVNPVDLLSFPVLPSAIGDRDLVDSVIHLGDLGGDLGFKAKPIRLQMKVF